MTVSKQTLQTIPWFVLCSLPFLLLLWTIARYGVDVPFKDELYALTPLMEKVLISGEWTLSDFYGQLNDHRPVIPVLLLTAAAWITNWNAHAELFLAPLFAALNIFLIYRLSLVTAPKLPFHARGVLMLLACILTFSITQWENWSQGINIAFLLPITFLLSGALVLSQKKRTWTHISVAAGLCVLASFSHAEGLLTWVALLPLIIFGNRTQEVPHTQKTLVLWFFLATLTFFLYFTGFTFPPRSAGSTFTALSHPLQLLLFALHVLGSPFFPLNSPLSALMGIAIPLAFLVTMYPFLFRRTPIEDVLPWTCLFLYTVLFALIVAVGRGSLSNAFREEFSSRMITSALPASLALFHILTLSTFWKHRALLPLLGLFVMTTTVLASPRAIRHWQERGIALREAKTCLLQYEVAEVDCLANLAFGHKEYASEVREAARIYQTIRGGRLQ